MAILFAIFIYPVVTKFLCISSCGENGCKPFQWRILRRKWLLIGLFAWDTYRCGAIFSNFNLAPVGELWGEHSPGEHL